MKDLHHLQLLILSTLQMAPRTLKGIRLLHRLHKIDVPTINAYHAALNALFNRGYVTKDAKRPGSRDLKHHITDEGHRRVAVEIERLNQLLEHAEFCRRVANRQGVSKLLTHIEPQTERIV